MKLILALSVAASLAVGVIAGMAIRTTTGAEDIKEIIDARRSVRAFSDRAIDERTVDNILWVAWGNNSTGTRTIPTAGNRQNLGVFAATADGVFRYNGAELTRVLDEDIRPLFSDNPGIRYAPLTLIYTGSDRQFSPMHAGSAYQNVALYVTSRRTEGLGDVVRIRVNLDAIANILPLAEDEFVIVTQTVGYRPE
ncbi:MAG: nitroreductase family protein [Alphaproteobacteria bacterium]|nr:nitroreductase family protein [Alphaproteobacteria bacterium]